MEAVEYENKAVIALPCLGSSMRRGIATFTLDTGRCPPWLFQRMVKLGREMVRVLVAEHGPDEFI
ncbi:MAG: DUF763 domain-containing protein, partial [Armatimonadetes bacterium]|nr:DUF763 domain-containing protein [Armatimonadota bacterium]